jgi:hypothetical protein
VTRTGLLAELGSGAELRAAVAALRSLGYRELEAYSPLPVHGLDEALGAPPSRLPRAVFAVGVSAAAAAYGLQYLLNAYLYPLDVGGRPPHLPVAYVPITFEMGVLGAALTAFLGVLWKGRLLRLWQPIFEIDRFVSASSDGFWVRVATSDPRFDREGTAATLLELGARHVTLLEEVVS